MSAQALHGGWQHSNPALPLDGALTTLSTRLRLVEDIIERGGRACLLDVDNEMIGTVEVSRAVADDVAFFVGVAPDVLALDFDAVTAREEAARAHVTLLRLGFAPVLCASGQPGRRHVFCKVPPRERARVLHALGISEPSALVRRDIRPPLTLHRDQSARSQLLAPAGASEAAARLSGSTAVRAMGSKAFHSLNTTEAEDLSRTVYSAALGAANAGWCYEDFEVALQVGAPISAIFARRVRRQGEARTQSWLKNHIWRPAENTVRCNPAVRSAEPDPALLEAAAWALARAWPSRSGPTDFCVFLALLWGWRRSGRSRFNLSQREIEGFAGISSRATVAASLNRLLALRSDGEPILRRRYSNNAAERMANSVEWEICVPRTATSHGTQSELEHAWRLISHDLFRNKVGLGKPSAMVLIVLREGLLLSRDDIAAATALSTAVVTRCIKDLSALGLLDRVDDRWCSNDGDLERAAEEIGAAGRGERQQAQISRERDARDLARSQYRTQRN